jgi:hypothetical protein
MWLIDMRLSLWTLSHIELLNLVCTSAHIVTRKSLFLQLLVLDSRGIRSLLWVHVTAHHWLLKVLRFLNTGNTHSISSSTSLSHVCLVHVVRAWTCVTLVMNCVLWVQVHSTWITLNVVLPVFIFVFNYYFWKYLLLSLLLSCWILNHMSLLHLV